jgi:hypothetical protein
MKQIYHWIEPDVPMSPAYLSLAVPDDGLGLVEVSARSTVNARNETGAEGVLRISLAEARKLWRALGEHLALALLQEGGK